MYCEAVTPKKDMKISFMIVSTVQLFKQYPDMGNADRHANMEGRNTMGCQT